MFRWKKCKGESAPTDGLNFTQVHVGEDTFEAVPTFQYFGDVIGESGGCVDATWARITAAWKGFKQLLPIITSCGILLRNRGNIFSSCNRKSLLYGCKTWPASSKTIRCLASADNGMVCKICGVRLEQRIRTQQVHEKLGIISVTEEIQWCKLRYFGHLQRMDKNVVPRRVNDYVVPGILPRGPPKLRWSDVITEDLKDINIGKNLLTNR